MSEHTYRFNIDVSTYTATLLVCTILLLAIHCGLYYYNYTVEELPWLLLQLFDVDEENNIPTWFSGFLLLNTSFVLYLAARAEQTKWKKSWGLLSVGFLVLSLDEVAGLHETFHSTVDFNWAIPGRGSPSGNPGRPDQAG